MPHTSDYSALWEAFRSKLTVRDEWGRTCPRPTDADLDRFEAESGFRFPTSYRGFAKVLGPGGLQVGRGDLRCLAPYCPNRLYGYGDPAPIRRWLENLAPDSTPNDRLFAFANDTGGHQFGWDQWDPTDPLAHEYRVYARPRWAFDGVVPMSHTFLGFMRLFTNQKAFRARMRSESLTRDVGDPRSGFFERVDGAELTRAGGRPIEKEFFPATLP